MRAGGRGRLLAESSPGGLSDVINAAAVAEQGTARAGPVPGQCEDAPALLGGQRKAKRWGPAVLETPRPPVVLTAPCQRGGPLRGKGLLQGAGAGTGHRLPQRVSCPPVPAAPGGWDSCDHHDRLCAITLSWVVDRKFPLAFPGLILEGAQATGWRGRGAGCCRPTQSRGTRGLCGQVESAGPARLVSRPAGWSVAGHQSVPTL